MLLLSNLKRLAWMTPFLLNLVACGGSQPDRSQSNDYEVPTNLHFDPEMQPYLDSYIADSAAAGVAIPEEKLAAFKGLQWTDHISLQSSADATILGHCQRRGTGSPDESHHLRFVEILRPNAEGKVGTTTLDDVTLKVMVYHELGHCLHDFSGHTNGKGAAVMNAYLQPARYFNLEALLRDHFKMLKRMQDDSTYKP